MKKIIIITLLTLTILCTPLSVYTNAETSEETSQENVIKKSPAIVWKRRIYNGKRQKRLWNNNTKKWLTDWITIC